VQDIRNKERDKQHTCSKNSAGSTRRAQFLKDASAETTQIHGQIDTNHFHLSKHPIANAAPGDDAEEDWHHEWLRPLQSAVLRYSSSDEDLM